VDYDLILRGGTLYDGSGSPGYTGHLTTLDEYLEHLVRRGVSTNVA
jgi:N-acyl-D-aspartate/D-glutamate deacylase